MSGYDGGRGLGDMAHGGGGLDDRARDDMAPDDRARNDDRAHGEALDGDKGLHDEARGGGRRDGRAGGRGREAPGRVHELPQKIQGRAWLVCRGAGR